MADRKVTFLINANIRNFERNLSKAQKSFRSFGKSLKSSGQSLTRNLTLPLGLAGLASVKLAADFQTSMRKIDTLVGLGSDRVNAMSKDVLNLSNVTGESSKSLADALFVITSAGQRGAEAMQILERSGKASAIGLGETKDVARAVTAVLNAYGPANISAAKAMDQLVSIVREGNLEAADLAPVLGRVIGIGSQLGISFGQIGASIATFTRLGVGAEEAVVGLRGIMNALIKPSSEARDTLETVGMTFSDLRKQVREEGLAVTLIDLIKKFEGNEEALGRLIPNVRALSAVLGTAGAQGQTYTQIARNIAGATGLVDDGFRSISGDTGFKFKQTLEQLKNLGIEIGSMLLPVVNKFLQGVKGALTWFKGLSTESKQLTIVIAGLVAALGPALIGLGTMAIIFGSISAPVLIVIAALAALGAAVLYVWDNWKALKERISDWSWWKNMLIDMAQFFIEYNPFSLLEKGLNFWLEKFGLEKLPNPFEDMADALEKLKDDTSDYKYEFKSFGDTAVSIFNRVKKSLSGLVGTGGGGILSTPTGGGGETTTAGPGKLQGLGSAIKGGQMNGLLPPSRPLQQMAVDVGNVKNQVVELGTAMQNVLNEAFAEFGETLGNLFTGDLGASNFFNNILLVVADFAKQFGKALIAAGVAALAFQQLLLNPFAAIAAGVALIAAATVIKNLLSKGPQAQGMERGGIVPEGFPNDSYPAALSSGEMVIPAPDSLPGFGGNTIILNSEMKLSYRDLLIKLKQEEKRMGRI